MRKSLTALAVALLMASTQILAAVPGFQDTVNHYHIPMDAPPGGNIHQWVHVDFIAHTDGRVDANLTFENDTWFGFTGRVRIIAKDAGGHVLLDVLSPLYAIGPKDPLHGDTPNRVTVPWSFQANPSVGNYGADLWGAPTEYNQDRLPLGISFGDIEKLADMVILALATS